MPTKSIKQKTVVQQLTSEIRTLIASGEYKHTNKLPTENELAQQFGVSRTSVREALKALNYLGILESHTSRGTRISEKNRIAEETMAWSVLLSFEKVREVFVLGTALDTQVTLMLLKRIESGALNETHIKEINSNIARIQKAAERNDLELFQDVFSQYFRLLYKASGNTVFISLNECIDNLIVPKVCQSYHQTNNLIVAADFLSSIWKAILDKELTSAIKLVQDYGEFAFQVFKTCDVR